MVFRNQDWMWVDHYCQGPLWLGLSSLIFKSPPILEPLCPLCLRVKTEGVGNSYAECRREFGVSYSAMFSLWSASTISSQHVNPAFSGARSFRSQITEMSRLFQGTSQSSPPKAQWHLPSLSPTPPFTLSSGKRTQSLFSVLLWTLSLFC